MAEKTIAESITEEDDPPKLTKKDPLFFQKIGAKGGRRTKANQGDAYFSSIARLSHASPARSSRTAPTQPEGDPAGRNRRKVGSRAVKTPATH